MRIVVTGSLKWAGPKSWYVLKNVMRNLKPSEVGHGDARGADQMADAWCSAHGVPRRPFPAMWRVDGKFDMRAGYRRNKEMLEAFGPDRVVAFKDGFDFGLRRGGTEHTVRLALAAGIPVEVWSSDGSVVYLPRHEQLDLLAPCQLP